MTLTHQEVIPQSCEELPVAVLQGQDLHRPHLHQEGHRQPPEQQGQALPDDGRGGAGGDVVGAGGGGQAGHLGHRGRRGGLQVSLGQPHLREEGALIQCTFDQGNESPSQMHIHCKMHWYKM